MSPHDENRALLAALARMACAIIGQTARDLAFKGEHVASARAWLEATPEESPFSVEACCEAINDWLSVRGRDEDRDYLQLDATRVREVLRDDPFRIASSLHLRADSVVPEGSDGDGDFTLHLKGAGGDAYRIWEQEKFL